MVNHSNNETNFHIPFSCIMSKTHAQPHVLAHGMEHGCKSDIKQVNQ